jgi:hypothetical protein
MSFRRTATLLLAASVAFAACGDPRSAPGREGPGSVADIAAFLPDSATEEELVEVSDLLGVPTRYTNSQGENRVGTTHIEGVYSIDWDYVDHALYVGLEPGIGDQRKKEIMDLLIADPRVVRLETDYLVPSHS